MRNRIITAIAGGVWVSALITLGYVAAQIAISLIVTGDGLWLVIQ